MKITEPGVYDLDETIYHADPVPVGSLSASGIKELMPPKTPAHFDYWRRHREPPKAAYEFGSGAHTQVLGVGGRIVVPADDDGVPYEKWQSNDAKARVAAIRAAGDIPLKAADARAATMMAERLRAHPDAARYLHPAAGKAEQSLFDIDPVTGVWKRARLDWLPKPDADGQVVIVDYKTTEDASPGAVARWLFKFGYYGSAAWYMDLVDSLGLSPYSEPVFVLIFQEKQPPHLVNVVQPDPDAIEWGRVRNRKALDLYRQCTEDDHWPGYPPGVSSVGLQRWSRYELETAADSGLFDTREDLESQP